MPRLRQLIENDRKDFKTKTQLMGRMKAEKISCDAMAELLGMSLPTFYRRRDNPETLTLREIRIIQQTFPGIEIQ